MRKTNAKEEKIVCFIGLVFTALGVYWMTVHDVTNGLLMMIMGELIDLPVRIERHRNPSHSRVLYSKTQDE